MKRQDEKLLPYAKANKTIQGEKRVRKRFRVDPMLVLFLIVLLLIGIFDLPFNP